MISGGSARPSKIMPRGMGVFTLIWSGQVVSLLGSAMSMFALLLWVWLQTHQATATALMGFFQFVPLLIMTPIAGGLVDRWDRKKAMVISDLAAGLGSAAVLVLYVLGALQVWHLYCIGLFIGVFAAFQWPAYSAAITTLVDKKHYARADGMMSLAESLSMILGPPMAAFLLMVIGIQGILLIDIFTFCFAISILLVVHIPQPPVKKQKDGMAGLWKDSLFGFRYIYANRPLLALTMAFLTFNLIGGFGTVVMAPMALARTGDDQVTLGALMSVLGIAALAGGMALALWGGPKRKIDGLLGGMMLSFIPGLAVLPNDPYFWAVGGFVFMFAAPITNGCSQAIWQSKVPPRMQGRVFAARRFIAQVSSIFGLVFAGPLADFVFEPGMRAGGGMASSLSWLVQPGPGAGMALMMSLSFILCAFVAIAAYLNPNLRNVEDIMPDHDEEVPEQDGIGSGDGKEKMT